MGNSVSVLVSRTSLSAKKRKVEERKREESSSAWELDALRRPN